jgi:peptidase C13-like protein
LAVAGALLWGLAPTAAAEQSHLVVIVGLGGEKEYGDAFRAMAVSMVGAAEKKLGLDPAHIVSLGEGESTRESVQKALREVARSTAPGDLVFILLIGHGSFQQGESRFNLRGPDMTAADFVPLLDALASRTVVFVNTASASGDFVKALMGRDRTIVTATKSAQERNETAFARHFVDAFATGGADADKDQRVSVMEAFEYARREVQRFYEKERRLLTEHAVLEDGRDGALARTLFLGAGDGETASADAGDPKLLALRQERRDVERRLDALKARKETTAAASYEEELEKLLLELALKDEEIRRRPADKRP